MRISHIVETSGLSVCVQVWLLITGVLLVRFQTGYFAGAGLLLCILYGWPTVVSVRYYIKRRFQG